MIVRRTPMKRTPMARGTTPVKVRSDKKVEAAPAEAIERARVFARDQVCQLGALRNRYAVGPCFGRDTFHHRRKAGQGGRYSYENGVLLCLGHNEAIEADANLARFCHSVGLVVRRGDPEWAELG